MLSEAPSYGSNGKTTMIRMRWRSWYGDDELQLSFPPSWRVGDYWPDGAPDIGSEGIESAFDNPIGAPTVQDLARGKRRVSIAVEDLSRPTPTARLIQPLIRRLEKAGVDLDDVRVVMAVGMHIPMLKEGIVKKLGQAAVDRLDVHNNYPHDNVVDLGVSDRGTPVRICRHFAESDLRIGIGTIIPHGAPGFSGGAKVVVPGVASLETVAALHLPGRLKTAVLDVDHNEFRAEIEHIVRDRVGLDCIVNAVTNPRREITGLFVGDMIGAHRAGVQLARKVYATEMPSEPVDIAICNAYPKDTECLQKFAALNVLSSCPRPVVKEGGTIVMISASPEGRGYHALFGSGMRYDPVQRQQDGEERYQIMPGKSLILYSPWVSKGDARGIVLFRQWDSLVDHLRRQHGDRATVAVFPCGSIQVARESVA